MDVSEAISPQNNPYESSYCIFLDISIMSLLDIAILEKSFPCPPIWSAIMSTRSKPDISLNLGTWP